MSLVSCTFPRLIMRCVYYFLKLSILLFKYFFDIKVEFLWLWINIIQKSCTMEYIVILDVLIGHYLAVYSMHIFWCTCGRNEGKTVGRGAWYDGLSDMTEVAVLGTEVIGVFFYAWSNVFYLKYQLLWCPCFLNRYNSFFLACFGGIDAQFSPGSKVSCSADTIYWPSYPAFTLPSTQPPPHYPYPCYIVHSTIFCLPTWHRMGIYISFLWFTILECINLGKTNILLLLLQQVQACCR